MQASGKRSPCDSRGDGALKGLNLNLMGLRRSRGPLCCATILDGGRHANRIYWTRQYGRTDGA